MCGKRILSVWVKMSIMIQVGMKKKPDYTVCGIRVTNFNRDAMMKTQIAIYMFYLLWKDPSQSYFDSDGQQKPYTVGLHITFIFIFIYPIYLFTRLTLSIYLFASLIHSSFFSHIFLYWLALFIHAFICFIHSFTHSLHSCCWFCCSWVSRRTGASFPGECTQSCPLYSTPHERMCF